MIPAGTSMCDMPGRGEDSVLGLEISFDCLQPGLAGMMAWMLPVLWWTVNGGLECPGIIM